jgi:hypothetical protein
MSKVKKKQRPGKQALPQPHPREVLERGARDEALQLLGTGRDAGTFIQVVDNIAEGAEWVIDQAVQQMKPAIACRAGCSHCCHVQVGVSPPEIFRLAAFIRERFTPEQLAALRARLAALDNVTRGMSVQERAESRLPCALLVEDRCSAHPARPLACMGWNSLDAQECRNHLEGNTLTPIPYFTPQCDVIDGAQAGLWKGLDETRHRPELLELTAALRIALDTPNAPTRWAGGEPIFAPARLGTVRPGKFIASETWKQKQ